MQQQIACEKCDLLLRLPALAPHQRAHCPRCRHLLMRRHFDDGFFQAVAFAIAALVFLLSALFYPFLGFSNQGRQKTMTLLETGTSLLAAQEVVLGVLVLFFTVFAPLLLIATLLALASVVLFNRGGALAPLCGRIFYEVSHWNLVEVFVIAVLVSLVKIASMASVELANGFWAFLGFSLCLWAAVGSLDRHQLWRTIRGVKWQ